MTIVIQPHFNIEFIQAVAMSVQLYHFMILTLGICLIELHKDAVCCFEQILVAAPYKTAAVWPLASHLTNYPSKTCWALLEK